MRNYLADVGGLSGAAGTLWRARGQAKWLLRPHADAAYLGWVGQGNIGDELMFNAHSHVLAPRELRPVGLDGPGRRLMNGRRPSAEVLLLGGGTVLNLDSWGRRLDKVTRILDYERLIVFGPGAEDTEFGIRRGLVSEEGQRTWRRLMSEAAFIGVRGPRSQHTLSKLGISSVVVGDPGLCVPLRRISPHTSLAGRPQIALNLTGVRNALPKMYEWRAEVARAAATWKRRGCLVNVFGMDSGDVMATLALLQQFGVQADKWIDRPSVSSLTQFLAGTHLVVSERLHGAIVSANLGVPFLHLGYKPKSFDFLESIGASERAIGIGTPNFERVIEAGDAIMGDFLDAQMRENILRLQEEFRRNYDLALS
ncbi:polysaccharide pyruvyl transferase family protein [Georgenia subflava]|uniref:Polysaccharide pyruvyl transferase domain-containing protein n=1 Tax=Georgenia subflava TaxID=1622177 RepID=A0A6N7EM68_9MICO|nr:polysaccharide pyruvyl transferase family protein [Georgenia subflava]MPV37615.1 hypothetical protein [Georgenia subflava]